MRTRINSYLYIISLFGMAIFLSSCDSSLTDSNGILSENAAPAYASEADAYFDVEPDSYSSAGGTVTIEYLGEEVSINYQSNWNNLDVATTLAQAIRDDSDIQLYANVYYYGPYPYTTIYVKERRTGSQYNNNPVYLSDSHSTNHIKLSDSVIYLSGGTD